MPYIVVGIIVTALFVLTLLLIVTMQSKTGQYDAEYLSNLANSSVLPEIKRIGGVYRLDDEWSVYAGYGEGFKMPTAQQLYYTSAGTGFEVIPNPDLRPESVQSYEAGLRGGDIGAIQVADGFSLVEVPAEAADHVIRRLRGATIRGNGAGLNGSYSGNGANPFILPEFGYVRQLSDSVAVGIAVAAVSAALMLGDAEEAEHLLGLMDASLRDSGLGPVQRADHLTLRAQLALASDLGPVAQAHPARD